MNSISKLIHKGFEKSDNDMHFCAKDNINDIVVALITISKFPPNLFLVI